MTEEEIRRCVAMESPEVKRMKKEQAAALEKAEADRKANAMTMDDMEWEKKTPLEQQQILMAKGKGPLAAKR